MEVRLLPSPPIRHRGHLAGLDVLRGGAALYVAAYHCVGALTPSGLRFDTEGRSARLLLDGNPLGLFGFGLYAVLAFFVLSGFVVHLRQAERAEERAPQARLEGALDYGWRRAMRVYPPLVGAVVVTALLVALGARLFPGWPWAQGSLGGARNVLVPVQGAATFANNGALWSVAYEVWFYLAYVPLLLVLLGPSRTPRRLQVGFVLVGSLAVAAALLVVQGQAPQLLPGAARGLSDIAVYFPAWAAGAFLAELHTGGVTLRRWREAAAIAALLVVVAAFHSGNQQRPTVDVIWVVAVGLLIAVLTLRPVRDRPASRAGRWAASTATWSYSLYLVHLPVIYFAQAAAGYDGARRIGNPLVVLAIFLATLASGWLFSLALERPSRWLVSRSPWRRPTSRRHGPVSTDDAAQGTSGSGGRSG